MKPRIGAVLLVAFASSTVPAAAANLPGVKSSEQNQVAACATPGRLTAYLKSRNPALAEKFTGIATEYMRSGEQLGVRWDYAFFQMIVETASLSYRRGDGKPGDVRPDQNNFAGLGATGNGEHGESFRDVATGVRAHLEHIMMYAGQQIESPVAERTRKVQEWGILTSWQKAFKRPITFTDLTRKWSPNDSTYSDSIDSTAKRFFADFCDKPDPQPELVQEARGQTASKVAVAEEPAQKVSGKELMRRAVERARSEGDGTRAGLGAIKPVEPAPAASEPAATPPQAALTLVNVPKTEAPQAEVDTPKAEPKSAAKAAAPSFQTAAVGAALRPIAPPPAAAPPATPPAASAPVIAPAPPSASCKVWTASYGGQKAVIIKAGGEQGVNYTVLDVNEGAEKREAEAYIGAYAKGGAQIGEFASQAQALDKAFELCPEG